MTQLIAGFYYFGIYHENLDLSHLDNHTLFQLSNLVFQRILGKEIQPGLRFFGQSMYGKIDLGDDGLPDIVVGSQGMAVVFRYGY